MKSVAVSKPVALVVFLLAAAIGATYTRRAPAAAEILRAVTAKTRTTDSLASPVMPVHTGTRRVFDEGQFLDLYNADRLTSYLAGIFEESGVDIRFVFARDVPEDLESFAVKRARELGMGQDMNKRSLLFVYDIPRQRMRLEVGPGMEGMFPDGLVGYLMREQTAAFFSTGNLALGLKSTLNIISYRLREAALDGTYNPRAVAFITNPVRLAEGAGASARVAVGDKRVPFGQRVATDEARAHFSPQPTVAGAFARYMEALRDGHYEPDLPLYTPNTQLLFRANPLARPFAEFVLFSEYGHTYRIVERGDIAILYFTNTPLVSAHLFQRTPGGWRLDIAAEVEDTREFVGGPFTWSMMLTGDGYTREFYDLFADYGPSHVVGDPGHRAYPARIIRPALGDNRPLPRRVGRAASPGRPMPLRPGESAPLLLPVADSRADNFGYPAQAIDQLAVRRLLQQRSFDKLDAVLTAYADSAVKDYRLEYRLFDAYGAFDVAIPALEPLLNEWVARNPESSAALLARGEFLNAMGWNARGAGYAAQTKRNQFQQMAGYFGRAQADLHAALLIAPNSIVAYRCLISTLMNGSDHDTMRDLLDRGLKIQPYSFRLRATYMETLLPRWGGSYTLMESFAQEAAPYAARNPRLRALHGYADWDRGRQLEGNHQKARAIAAYSRALAYGDFWRFRYERGDIHFRANEYKEAVADLDVALRQNPQHAYSLYDRSWSEYELGRDAKGAARDKYFAQAYDDILLAVALEPTDEAYQKHLAFVKENIPDYSPPPRP